MKWHGYRRKSGIRRKLGERMVLSYQSKKGNGGMKVMAAMKSITIGGGG